jgi:hypothetical protein
MWVGTLAYDLTHAAPDFSMLAKDLTHGLSFLMLVPVCVGTCGNDLAHAASAF